MNTLWEKPAFKTVLYYLIICPIVIYFNTNKNYRSGPCTPNLDVLSFFLAILSTMVLLVINGVLTIRRGKVYLPSLLIHVLVLVVVIISGVIESHH